MGERQDPPEQVKVNASAVFSLWWCWGGCVFYMVFVWCGCGSVFRFCDFFASAVQKKSKKHVSMFMVKNCLRETCPTHMSKKHFQQKPVAKTWSRNVFKKSVQQIIDGRGSHQIRDD